MRRHEADQRPAGRTAQREHQVEPRQVGGCRPQARRLAVQAEAQQEQPDQVDRQPRAHARADAAVLQPVRAQRQHRGCERQDHGTPVPAIALETQDEGQQVHRQRQHPEEGHRRHVLRDVVGHGQQQPGPERRQQEPQHLVDAARLRVRRARHGRTVAGLRHGRHHRRPHRRPARRDVDGGGPAQQHEHAIPRRPRPGLLPHRAVRLDQHRIAEQRRQRSQVGQREVAVHLRAPRRARDPRLHQWPGGGQQEVREPDGRDQQAEDAQGRLLAAAGLPGRVGQHRHEGQARQQQRAVQLRLRARLQPAGDPVGVGVARQQRDLEEHHADRPHRRRAAEPGQDLLGDQRLHQEQQEGADEDGAGEQRLGRRRLHAR